MKSSIRNIIFISIIHQVASLNDTWAVPRRDLNAMTTCPYYWNNGSNYLCQGDDFDYQRYGELGPKKCRCDESCQDFKDCCLDTAYDDTSTNTTTNQVCLPLPSTSNNIYGIYMVNWCQSNWGEDGAKYLCETDLDLEEVNNGSITLTYSVPVHSRSTGNFYKNVYCAACNSDNSTLTEWALVTTGCFPQNVSDQRVQVTLVASGRYVVQLRDQLCHFQIEEFANWTWFYETFSPRPCLLRLLDTCSDESSPAATHCDRYLAPVYRIDRRNRIVTTYKNFHCAMCNPVATTNKLVCEDYGIKRGLINSVWFQPPASPSTKNIRMLLNFNFAKGLNVVDGPRCKTGEIHDPLLSRCVLISCGRLYAEKNGRCVLKDGDTDTDSQHHPGIDNSHTALKSDCPKATLYPYEFIVLQNKSLLLSVDRIIHPSQYEVEIHPNGTWKSVLICAKQVLKIIDFNDAQQILSRVCLTVSVVCLCLQLAVYGVLPTLRNLPGKTLMSMSASLAVADTLFLIGTNFDHRPSACHIIGVLKHYAYLAVFFWTNIMAMDIHRTFSGNTVLRSSSSAYKTYAKYALYAWGSPGIIVLAAVLLDTFLQEGVFKPHYGHGICWISQRPPLLIFFAAPAAIILVSNMVLFGLTARSLKKTARETKMAKRFSDRLRFALYVKLATVLGLTWVFGFLAAVADVDVLWYPFILFIGLQGVIIFVSFTCKRKILNLLRQRFGRKGQVNKASRYLRDKSNLSAARSMATSSTSLSISSLNLNKVDQNVVKSHLTPPRHPRVDYIRVNSG